MSDQQVTHQANSITAKDFMIPVSIIIAGFFVGAGLYFGGPVSQAGSQVAAPIGAQPEPAQPVEQADTTNLVTPINDSDHIKGSIDAPIQIVEYSDFDCPFCSRFHVVMDEIVKERDDVVWAYRHFPLEQLHPQAATVSAASECVAELAGSDAFWSFTDGYFSLRGAGDGRGHSVVMAELAAAAGVSETQLNECLDSGRTQAAVEEDVANAVETGGRGTPWSILIGPSGKTYPINGALPKSAIEQLIQIALDEA